MDTLEGKEAKRKNLPKGKSYDIICFFGHGEERSLLGSDGRAIFNDDNIDYMENAVVIAIACKSANWLAMSAASKAAKCYFGFRDICYLPKSSEKHAYMSDFIRTFSVPLLALLEGYTVHLALEQLQSLCREYAAQYEEKEYDPYSGIMASWMIFNANCSHYEGAPNATLGEEALVVKWSP